MLACSRHGPHRCEQSPKVTFALAFALILVLSPVGQGANNELHHNEAVINMDEDHGHGGHGHGGQGHGGHGHGDGDTHGSSNTHDGDTHGSNNTHDGDTHGDVCGLHEDGIHECEDTTLKAHLVLAYVMMGFVVFILGILYLINYRNVFVRSATYQMLCMSISVYCAVLLNHAIMDLLGWLGSLVGMQIEITFGLMIFLGDYVVLYVLCKRFQEKHSALMVLESLGGHLMAFAGIVAFGNMLFSCWYTKTIWRTVLGFIGVENYHLIAKYLFVVGTVTVGLLLLFGLSRKWRQSKYNDEAHHWIEEVSGAENEASALIFGFLVLQTSILIVTNKQPALHDHTCKLGKGWKLRRDAFLLSLIGVAFLMALVIVSCIKTQVKQKAKNKADQIAQTKADHDKPAGSKVVPSFNFRRALAMSAAYCIERASKWLVISFWNDTQIAHVLSAFSLTFLSAFAVLFLTHVLKIDDASIKHERERHFADALEALFQAFAVLIGLGWDHAFEVCETQIVHQLHRYGMADGVSKMLLALFLCSVVIPAWAWYILPPARQPLDRFRETLGLEHVHYENWANTRPYDNLDAVGSE